MKNRKPIFATLLIFLLVLSPTLVFPSSMMWSQTYGPVEGISSVQQTDDGGYVFTGWICPHSSSERNIWLVKTDEHGIISEFPSWTLMLIMLVAVMVVVVIFRRRLHKQNQWRGNK